MLAGASNGLVLQNGQSELSQVLLSHQYVGPSVSYLDIYVMTELILLRQNCSANKNLAPL